ncbi:MAG: nucleoside/nucleotide kinase family protein [Burkholderiaceae bacterium]
MTMGPKLRELSPADPPPWLDDPAARLVFLCTAASAPKRLVVGLAGLPGAGKSTRAQALVEHVNLALGVGTAQLVGMDGFHLTRRRLAEFADPAAALARRGAPWTFDPSALAQRLRQLRAMPWQGTGDVRDAPMPAVAWPGFSHGTGDPVEGAITVYASVRLVLLEGLYLLHRDHGWNLSGLLDECWFLDLPLAQAMERLTLRHMATRNMDRTQASARVQANDRLNARIVAASRYRAHWRIADAAY